MNPRPTTYGEHAENVAGALTRLMSGASIPTEESDVDQLLFYRDVVADSLRQRLHDLALLPVVDRAQRAPAAWATKQEELLPTAVAAIASELPRRPPPAVRPMDLFARRSDDPAVGLWRTAAVESMSASHVLSTSSDRTWRQQESARWHVLRDVSTTLESLLILDDALREVGLRNEHDAPVPSMDATTRRAVLSQTTRLAGWFAPSEPTDHAVAAPDTPAPTRHATPVHLVKRAADLPGAQRALASSLRARTATNTGFADEPHITATSARHLVSGQLFVLDLARRLAPQPISPGGAVDIMNQSLTQVDRQIQRLIDLDPSRSEATALPFLQQAEIVTSLHRLLRDRQLHPLTPAQADEWGETTRAATHALAVSLRRELLRDDSNLRIDDLTGSVGPTRVLRRSALECAVTALIAATREPASAATTVTIQRAVLRCALDETPPLQAGALPVSSHRHSTPSR
ncbi:hypothetical protein [Nocardioides bruguierae]|uniref:Uncharacterized protein n=1 Tax=Nocardioides bruguierae TaxID=2945102 RepID=A0A9X2D9Q3_9ACTN|nr:hypothetical protein [Nocardioides bruguierae]MCM0621960.1 hypothetical protein [Nocardioides bruguierae]